MEHNLVVSPDGEVGFALRSLRELDWSGLLAPGQHLVPGVFFSTDPEATNQVEVESRPGQMLTARTLVDQPGRWLSLNLSLGPADLTGCGIVGLALKSDAPGTTTCRPCLRSGTAEGVRDVFFPKVVVSYPKTSLHLDVLELDRHPEVPRRADWRELIFFFEVVSQEFSFRDCRVFIL